MWELLLMMLLVAVGGFSIGAMLLHSSRTGECRKVVADFKQAKEDADALTKRVANLEDAAELWTKNETRQGNGVSG